MAAEINQNAALHRPDFLHRDIFAWMQKTCGRLLPGVPADKGALEENTMQLLDIIEELERS